jgi:RimJ/RimL family protein N-acetyltransferase
MWRINFFKPRPTEPPPSNVAEFLAALAKIAPSPGRGDYVFPRPAGGSHGFVQFLAHSHRELVIHRLFARHPGEGGGSIMLRALCDLADRHGVELTLKALPFGGKPYPKSREQLVAWYQRYGFVGTHKKMTRKPTAPHPTG